LNIEGILDSLGDESARVLRGVLKKAYEQGYREGLAASGHVIPSAVVNVAAAPPEPRVTVQESDEDIDWLEDGEEESVPIASTDAVAPTSGGVAPVSWGGASEADDADDAGRAASADVPRPISAGATIGTLKVRIIKLFALERFSVDVIVCRKGDKERRQLKSNVRLSKYHVAK